MNIKQSVDIINHFVKTIKFDQILTCLNSKSKFLRGTLKTSMAPHGVILYLDHTDGVIDSGLEHVSCFMKFVLDDVILQNVIMRIKTIIPASCN